MNSALVEYAVVMNGWDVTGASAMAFRSGFWHPRSETHFQAWESLGYGFIWMMGAEYRES